MVMEPLVDKPVEKKLPDDYPSKETIEQWKEEYGEIAQAEFGEDVYIYRGMLKSDKTKLKELADQGMDQEKLDEEAMKLCVLYPVLTDEKINAMKAGTITFLSDDIVRLSGFLPDKPPELL